MHALNDEAGQELLLGWKLLAALLIYPLTIMAGLSALMRIISGCCVTLDSWSPEGALGNFMLGFPAMAGLAALWVSTLHHASWTASDRVRFVLVATGLMAGIVMELNFLRSGFVLADPRFRSPRVYDLWTFGGPLLVAITNLHRMIRAREQFFAMAAIQPRLAAVELSTRSHEPADPVLRPVRLRQYPGVQAVQSTAG